MTGGASGRGSVVSRVASLIWETGGWLHQQLRCENLYKPPARSNRSAGKVEFNRYYMRAVCRQASPGQVRTVRFERREQQPSEEGVTHSADELLDYLRLPVSERRDSGYGRLGSANSGMTVERV